MIEEFQFILDKNQNKKLFILSLLCFFTKFKLLKKDVIPVIPDRLDKYYNALLYIYLGLFILIFVFSWLYSKYPKELLAIIFDLLKFMIFIAFFCIVLCDAVLYEKINKQSIIVFSASCLYSFLYLKDLVNLSKERHKKRINEEQKWIENITVS